MFNSNVICTAVYNYLFNIEATCGMVILAGPVIFLKFTVKKTKSTVRLVRTNRGIEHTNLAKVEQIIGIESLSF